MVTQNGRLTEVTEAAERMGSARPDGDNQSLTTEIAKFSQRKQHRGLLVCGKG